ncbi:MAG: guanylate kinase [bacterium]
MSPDGKRSPGCLIVFAAPSGAGKTTIIHQVMQRVEGLTFSVSSTTRARKEGEVDGVDYNFLGEEEFDTALKAGDFLEHEIVHGKLYGTRISKIQPLLDEGKDVVFDLDVLGALNVKRLFPQALLIYIEVLSTEILRDRLRKRGRENDAEIDLRLKRYEMERSKAQQFDRVVINDDLECAVQEIVDVIERFRSGEHAASTRGGRP